jgi:hypothetical protein
MNEMKTVVTITPLKVEADSRTFKQATSMRRFGFFSVVIEGEASKFTEDDLSFDLRSMRRLTSNTYRLLSKTLIDEHLLVRTRRVVKMTSKILPNSLKDFLKFILFTVHYLYRAGLRPLYFIPRASLYYLHAPYLFPAIFFTSKFYRVPFIYDAHDFYIQIEDDHERSPFEHRWIDPFYKKIEEICIRHAVAVVTVSEGIAHLIRETFHVQPIVIRSCEDLRLEKPLTKSLRDILSLSPSDFLLVSIGHAKQGMAIRECIEAIAMLPSNVHLAFVGKNYEPFWEMICNNGLEGRIHLVQPVKPFEVISFVKSADATIILYYARSVNYAFSLPNKLFQSISAELPVLYSELPEIKRLAETYELGIRS